VEGPCLRQPTSEVAVERTRVQGVGFLRRPRAANRACECQRGEERERPRCHCLHLPRRSVRPRSRSPGQPPPLGTPAAHRADARRPGRAGGMAAAKVADHRVRRRPRREALLGLRAKGWPAVAAGPGAGGGTGAGGEVGAEGLVPGGRQAAMRPPEPLERQHQVSPAPLGLERSRGVALAEPHGDPVPEPELRRAAPRPLDADRADHLLGGHAARLVQRREEARGRGHGESLAGEMLQVGRGVMRVCGGIQLTPRMTAKWSSPSKAAKPAPALDAAPRYRGVGSRPARTAAVSDLAPWGNLNRHS
jgi:hypothetical protein